MIYHLRPLERNIHGDHLNQCCPARGEPGVGMKPKPFPRATKAQILILSCALKDRCEVSNQVIVLESQEKLMNKSTPSVPAGYWD